MKRQERYRQVLEYFESNEQPSETELKFGNPFELLVAVVLSAQCTDKRVNLVTPALFRDYPTAVALSHASPETIFPYIRSISYPNNKAKHLAGLAKKLVDEFNGKVPSEVEDLVKLPGVGRKTANVIASVIYNKPAMAVDTHVFRVSNRLGLTVNANNPLQSEKQLIKFIPEHLVPKAHHWLILHGRYVCLARTPKCWECPLTRFCKYFEKNNITEKDKNIKHQIKQIPHGKEDTEEKSGEKAGKKSSKKSDEEGRWKKSSKKGNKVVSA
jgi:endonuclease III